MKKFLHLLLFVLVVFTSCEKTAPKDDPQSSAKGVSFTYKGANFEEADIISLFAASEKESSYAKNVSYSLSGDTFTSEEAITYPSGSSSLQFYALYPSLETLIGEFKIDVDQHSEQSAKYNNFQVASVSSKDLIPELAFESKVATVEVNNDYIELESLSISMKRRIVYDVVADIYEGAGQVGAITPCHVSDEKYSAVVAPQNIEEGSTVVAAEFDGESYWWSVSNDITVPIASRCIFDMSLANNEPIIERMIIETADGSKDEVRLVRESTKPKQPINIVVNEIRSTTVIVDVEVEPEVGDYFLYSMPYEYVELDYAGDLRAAAEGILAFWAYYGVPLVVGNGFVFNQSITGFDMAAQTDDFEINAEYVIFAFGVNTSNNTVTTDVYSIDVHTDSITDEDRANYSAWVGDWSVTSSSTYGGSDPVSFDVSIEADLELKSFYVTGWDLSIMRDIPIKLFYDANDCTINFPSECFMSRVGDTEELIIMRCFSDLGYGEPSYITGIFNSMTGEMAEDGKSAIVNGYKGVISTTKAEFQISHVATAGVIDYCLTTEVMRLFGSDDEGTPIDYPKGPYTMVKKSAASAPRNGVFNRKTLHNFATRE